MEAGVANVAEGGIMRPIKKMKNPTLVKNMQACKMESDSSFERTESTRVAKSLVKQDTKKPEKLNGRQSNR